MKRENIVDILEALNNWVIHEDCYQVLSAFMPASEARNLMTIDQLSFEE